MWSPGNAAIEQGRWREDELRFIDVINQASFGQGHSTRCILLLPPLPIAQRLRDKAVERRQMLRRHASLHNWSILDAERIAGKSGEGAQVFSEGIYTRYPNGAAQADLRKRLEALLFD